MTCSGEQKVTRVVLKVDLDCCQCYKKIKRSLCRFPQIRDQIYDEKQNTVCITIFCCSPENVLDRLCSKAGKSIKSVHIVPPPKKPAESDPPKPKTAPAPAPVEAEKPKPKPAAPAPEPEKQKPAAPAPAPAMKKNGSKNGSKNASAPAPAPKQAEEAPKAAPAPKQAEEAPKAAPAPAPAQAPKANEPAQLMEPVAQWVPGYPPGPPPQVYPVSVYCAPPYDGGYPCHAGPPPGFYHYGRPQCPPGYYANRCDYFSEENPSACSIM